MSETQTHICHLCGLEVPVAEMVAHPLAKEDGIGSRLHAECLDILTPLTPKSCVPEYIGTAIEHWQMVPPKLGTYTASHGIEFTVAVVLPGAKYGRRFACVNDRMAMAMVEFYEARHSHTRHGQFVSRYHLDSFMGCGDYCSSGDIFAVGLDLDGGVPDWRIDGKTRKKIAKDLMSWFSGRATAEVQA